ncbi:DUF1361 domain-containing protein [Secundilactobacillus kimchicus]|uniref:DUF1361 domain-containing protein n=1 Tax=Secundilactobacillus kimchicus TaxID=528209 RepID=UPI001C027341|nr:DUF1361 domain-containing protein [Secundilactobacillus kimchicus]MBT9670926.1 DUF1361 domain-containing protein [Secundilactobacillus kimchicus]
MRQSAQWQIRVFFGIWMLILWQFAKAPFSFLLLNTFLGYLPIEISFHVGANRPRNHFLFWAIVVVWLLFYPNAPYLLTDLFHLSLLNAYTTDGLLAMSVHVWIYFTFIIVSTLFCVVLGFWSLRHVAQTIAQRYFKSGWAAQSVLVVLLTFLTSVGIYAGRFQRIHTIYLFISPDLILHRLLAMWTPKMLMFVGLMTLIQLIAYWLFNRVTTPQPQLNNRNQKETKAG